MKYIYDKMSDTEKWLICTRLGLTEEEFSKALGERNDERTFDLDIQFSINGVDVSFSALAERCHQGWDLRVEELLEERSKVGKRLVENLANVEELAFQLTTALQEIRTGNHWED
jgi:hypothetical protein